VQLQEAIEQFKILSKNPMIRSKKGNNLASTQILDLTLNFDVDYSDSSSSEVCFPDKLQVETKVKPNLPKLDFTRVLKGADKTSQPTHFAQVKSKTEYLEKMCKEKTEILNSLRQKIKSQLMKNAELVNMQNEKSSASRPVVEKKKKKRAMSNALDYLTPEVTDVKKEVIIDVEDKSARISIESLDNMSSFNGSEVEKLDFQEPDSILCEYIHEINQK
jgi:hypothetical protein